MRRPALKVTTFLVLSALYSIIVLFSIFSDGLFRVVERWGDGFEMTIYLKDSLLPTDLKEIETQLNAYNKDIQFTYITKSEAMNKFKETIGDTFIDLEKDPEMVNVFSDHYKINLKQKMEVKSQESIFDQITKTMEALSSIDEISYGKEWLRKYSKLILSFKGISYGLYLVLIVTMLFVIGNTIRTDIYSKKSEIEILEMVGATRWEIRKPFYVEAIVISFFSMLIAVLGVSAIIYFIKTSVPEFVQYSGLTNLINYLSMSQVITLFIISFAVGLFGTWLCVHKLNNGWSTSQGTK